MGNKQVNKSRRALINTTLGLGALGVVAPSSWTKPLVSAVILPAHADMSPVDPPLVDCPTIVVGDVSRSGNGSGAVACTLSFTFFSATATPLDITDITFTTAPVSISEVSLVNGTTFTGATDIAGPGVVISFTQTGGACSDPTTILLGTDDVTFTVDATCENGAAPVSVDFTLSSIVAML